MSSRAKRGDPEDWCTSDYAIAPPFNSGIAAVAMLPRNDGGNDNFKCVSVNRRIAEAKNLPEGRINKK